jgi:hypothetical protein
MLLLHDPFNNAAQFYASGTISGGMGVLSHLPTDPALTSSNK